MGNDIAFCDVIRAYEFIQCWQGGGQLWAGDDFGMPNRNERCATACIRAIAKTHALFKPQRMLVHLPTGRAMHLCGFSEYFRESVCGLAHFCCCPLCIGIGHVVLPAHMIVAMNADFETRIAHAAQHIGATSTDVGAG